MTTINARDYQATGDGVTDDRQALQNAYDAVGQMGGGTLFIPAGRYRLGSYLSSGGLSWCLTLNRENVTIRGEANTRLLVDTTSPAAAFHLGGHLMRAAAVGGDPLRWYEHQALEYGNVPGSGAPLTPLVGSYEAGATELTLGGDALIVPGDWLLVRTGQLLPGRLGQPDGEFVEVGRVSGRTVYLLTPLSKPYAPEWFASGTTGLTSRAPTANPAPYGAAVVTDYLMAGLTVEDLSLVQLSGDYPLVIGGYAIEPTLRRLGLTGGGLSLGANIGLAVEGCSFMEPGPYWASADTCSTGARFTDCYVEDEGVSYLHLHEGTAHAEVRDCTVRCGSVPGAGPLVSVAARAYDVRILGNHLSGGGDNTALVNVDATCTGGGIIAGNVLRNSNRPRAIALADGASGWTVGDNDLGGLTAYVPPPNVWPSGTLALPATALDRHVGAPTFGPGPFTVSRWSLPAGGTQVIGAAFPCPPGWRSYDVWVGWWREAAGTGSVYWQVQGGHAASGQDLASNITTTGVGLTPIPIAAGSLAVTKINAVPLPTGGDLHQLLHLFRLVDTYPGGACVGWVELRRVG